MNPEASVFCIVCGQSREWHDENETVHEFRSSVPQTQPAPTPRPDPAPHAPADLELRLALIRAGVLREEELTEARNYLDAARREGKAVVIEPDLSNRLVYKLVDIPLPLGRMIPPNASWVGHDEDVPVENYQLSLPL